MSLKIESPDDPYRKFREAVSKRLEEEIQKKEGMSKKSFSEALGVSWAWVSQLLSGTRVKPSKQKVIAIANILGHDILETLDKGLYQSSESTPLGPVFPLLWSSRIKLLRSLADGETSKDKQGKQERLRNLARDIERAAIKHPLGIKYKHGTSIASPRDLAISTSLAVKHLVLAELAFMKIDAPFSMGIDRANFLLNENSYLADLAKDFGVNAESVREIRDVWRFFQRKARLGEETYSELHSCGGPLGELNFLTSDAASGIRPLVGFDLVGWTDPNFIAGIWLVKNLNLASENQEAKSVLPKWANQFKLGGSRNTLINASTTYLGEVVGASVNYFPSSFSYPSNISGKFAEPSVNAIAMTCIFLGSSWVRIEIAKIMAFYASSFFEESLSWEKEGFPDPWELEEILGDIWNLFDSLAKSEKLVSSKLMQEHKRNRQYKDLIDIRDSFELARNYIGTYREKHFEKEQV